MATPFGELLGKSDAEMNAELNDYVALGVDWLRIDIHWTDVQKSANGSYNWSQYDKVFKAAADKGIKIVAILNNAPSWVDSSFSNTASQTAYGNFAKAAAQHFGDTVDYWEIYNEPNINGVNATNYTKMLKAAYTAIKSVDSDDVVITGGLSPVPPNTNGMYGAADYVKTMYANGAKGYFDAVGFHPYTQPLTPKDNSSWNGWQIMEDGIRGAMVANGDADKQVWITELGSPTKGDSRMTEALQQKILTEGVELAKSYDWAGPIMWYSYQDRGGNSSDTENWFGLVGPNGEKKAVYNTYKQLGNADDGEPVSSGNNNTPSIQTPSVTQPDADDGDGVHVFTKGTGDFTINDFKDGDKIDLSAIDANILVSGKQGFNFVGSNWLKNTADLGVYTDTKNGYTYVQGSTDGDTAYEFSIKIKGVHQLDKNDFILSSSGGTGNTGGTGSNSSSSGATFKVTKASGVTTLTNFKDGDKIDLSAIDANRNASGVQDFKYVGSNWLKSAGDLGVYYSASANKTYVQADTNGDGSWDLSVEFSGQHGLTADDFIL